MEGFETKRALLGTMAEAPKYPKRAFKEIRGLLSTQKQVVLLEDEIRRVEAMLRQKAENFILQVNDFLAVKLLDKQQAFAVLKRILNFSPVKLECARLKHDTFLDYYLPESHLECHRGFLRLDDYYVKALTLKEPSAQSFPLIFQKLLEVEANFFIVTEWKKESSDKARSVIHSRHRHYHTTKRSFVSQTPPAVRVVSDLPEGLAEMFRVNRLGLSPGLMRCLFSTNVIERRTRSGPGKEIRRFAGESGLT